jgi:hypothetical protein
MNAEPSNVRVNGSRKSLRQKVERVLQLTTDLFMALAGNAVAEAN